VDSVTGGELAADAARREADVVLVAGSQLGNLDLPYDNDWGDPAHATLIQIDVDPRHLGVARPLALGLVTDVRGARAGRARASIRHT
jgi:acetolactate synthase-1/2/3 large subunit